MPSVGVNGATGDVQVETAPSKNPAPNLMQSLQDLPELPFMDGPLGHHAQFILGATIGYGGAGVVHEAEQVVLARAVAVKQLLDSGDAQAQFALLQEALVTGHLEHPNIVPVHTLGKTEDGSPVMVMKVIRGTPWTDVIDQPEEFAALLDGQDPLGFHLEVLCAVCNAAQFAHTQHVLHRDLKPDNIMIGSFGEVSVLDWGLAALLEPVAGLPLPMARDICRVAGTPAFLAPEMASPTPGSIGVHTDVYLLGATLHYMLTGCPRHDGQDLDTVLEQAQRSAPAVWPSEVPHELAALCDRACHVDPAKRPASADELRRELHAFLRHRGAIALLAQGSEQLAHIQELLRSQRPSAQVDRLIIEARYALTEGLKSWPEHGDGAAALRELDAIIDLRAAERESLLHQAWDADVTVGQLARLRALKLDAGAAAGICFAMYLALHSGLERGWAYPLALGGFTVYWAARATGHWLFTARATMSRTSDGVEHAQAIGHAAATLAFGACWYSSVDFGLAVALWAVLHATVYLVVEATTAAGGARYGYLFLVAAAAMVALPSQALLLCALASAVEWGTLMRTQREAMRQTHAVVTGV